MFFLGYIILYFLVVFHKPPPLAALYYWWDWDVILSKTVHVPLACPPIWSKASYLICLSRLHRGRGDHVMSMWNVSVAGNISVINFKKVIAIVLFLPIEEAVEILWNGSLHYLYRFFLVRNYVYGVSCFLTELTYLVRSGRLYILYICVFKFYFMQCQDWYPFILWEANCCSSWLAHLLERVYILYKLLICWWDFF